MDLEDGNKDVVHPEVRAHINSLVSALGGPSVEDDGRYRLGDDALEVLRDLKRWIRFYDEKTNRMDVARCLAESNLVEGDLLPILSMWTENETDDRYKARIALACFELLVPLTWPFDRDPERTTVNHHRHIPVLELAQVAYKRAVINYDGAQVLHTAVRAALPSMAVNLRSRNARDQGIIKLALFLIRNMAMIAPAPGVQYDGDESQISRSATIDAFSYQDIFLLLLTIASNMGDDFDTEDVTVMDVIFHLVKRVDVEKLFMREQQLNKHKDKELISMMAKEAQMKQGYKKSSGRHNRFGAMVWVQRDGHKMSTVSGADALLDSATRQRKMDNSKSYRPPRRAQKKEEPDVVGLGAAVSLNAQANDQLRAFVEEFLDSGFNPLFMHIRKTIDSDGSQLLHYHRRQFFYLVAWLLQAERLRRKQRKPTPEDISISSFNLIAGVLNQEMFITLSRAMHQTLDGKEWRDLTAVMRCFTEILVTVQEMRECGNSDDEEIAENILARLFYEDATHDCVANIVRSYKDQGFDYLDAATELAHHFLRILEAYSRQNVDMQVRSRKANRRKKRQQEASQRGEEDDGDLSDNSVLDTMIAERTTGERKFDFGQFAARFCTQGAVNTFLTFARFYRDLSDEQLKRAHRYFYRLCFKQELCTIMFRVDIIHLLHSMIKGPEPIDKSSSMYKDWEELSRQILKRVVRKVQERPQLVVELLFSKINSTLFFLENGFDKPLTSANPRPAAELEFKHATEKGQQIAIVVGAMLDKTQSDLLTWVKEILGKAELERRAWEESNAAIAMVEGGEPESAPEPDPFVVRPSEEDIRKSMFKNAQLRLLLKLCDVSRLAPTLDETPDSAWIIASSVKADTLKESIDMIRKAEFSPPTFDEGELAEDQLKRKTAPRAPRKRAEFDDDEDMQDMIDDGDEILFPAGGPTARKVIDDDKPKKTRRRRAKDPDEELADSEAEEHRKKRREKEREKARKVKSAMYVTAEDDEDDEEYDREFFAREEDIRKRAQRMANEVGAEVDDVVDPGSPGTRKRKAEAALDEMLKGRTVGGDDVDMEDADPADEKEDADDVEDDEDDETEVTPPSPGPKKQRRGGPRKRRRLSDGSADPEEDDDGDVAMEGAKGNTNKDEDDDDDVPAAKGRRARTKGGFVVDSDDE